MGERGSFLPLTQVGAVVKDIRKTMELYHELFGWGPWYIYEYKAPWFHDGEIRGRPAEYSMLSAEVEVGPIWFELIQPLHGPSIYEDWLEARGEGLHHLLVGWEVPTPLAGLADVDDQPASAAEKAADLRERCQRLGIEVMMSGKLGEGCEFYYLDTEPMLKVIIEGGSGDSADLQPVEVWPPQEPARPT